MKWVRGGWIFFLLNLIVEEVGIIEKVRNTQPPLEKMREPGNLVPGKSMSSREIWGKERKEENDEKKGEKKKKGRNEKKGRESMENKKIWRENEWETIMKYGFYF